MVFPGALGFQENQIIRRRFCELENLGQPGEEFASAKRHRAAAVQLLDGQLAEGAKINIRELRANFGLEVLLENRDPLCYLLVEALGRLLRDFAAAAVGPKIVCHSSPRKVPTRNSGLID